MGDLIHIGVITSVNPGKRSLRIEMPRSRRRQVLALDTLICVHRNGTMVRCRVASIKEVPDGLIATVVAGVPRDTIAQLKKHAIAVTDDPALRDAEQFDAKELAGLTLVDSTGTAVGRVTAGFETSANAMIEVDLHGGGAMLLPVTSDVVAQVDWTKECLALKPGVPLDGGMNDDNEEPGAQA